MGQDLFKYLPSDIILNIFLRLTIPTTMSCKCVCMPWLDLLESPEFVKSHHSKQVSGLVVFIEGGYPKPYKVFEFVDEIKPKPRVRPWNMTFNFNLPCNDAAPYSSVDGLLFLCTRGMVSNDILRYKYLEWPRDLFICNPFTHQCIKLPCPPESSSSIQMDTFEFGLSRMSGQYKLVRIFHEWKLGKVPVLYRSSVDLSAKYTRLELDHEECLNVYALKDCLCLCDNSADDEIVIWLMKEYGAEKSWSKEFVIRKNNPDYNLRLIWPVKAFKNGDVLMALEIYNRLLYYSGRTKTIGHVDLFGLKSTSCINATNYTLSFLPLKAYVFEKVTSFY